MNIQWNAQGYTQNFSFVHEYGRGLIDLLEGGGLSVLDLGCGNGALTQRLAQAGFRAEGLDASPELSRPGLPPGGRRGFSDSRALRRRVLQRGAPLD